MRAPTEFRSRSNPDQPIERRILDALIWIVHVRKWQPKAIYLTEEDYALFRSTRRTYRERHYVDGIPVRIGKKSRFYAHCWRGRAI